ncbi:MAG: allophanate hydrolase [Gammaproteobacteria bacterium]|nr:allophanate hydrolase [Gammaproteobacteria bacterium]
MTNNINLAIFALQKAYVDSTLTPGEVVDYIHDRCNQYKDNSIWIRLLSRDELQPYLDKLNDTDMAALPLFGIPFAIKDNIDLVDVATTAACAEYSYLPRKSAFVVQQLINAGAIPIGKTNLDQFATGLVGTRSPFGVVSNAFNPTYISGGSSSGSSVAVALGLVSFALGTDTAGSGRVPAAFNNLIGFKPSRGLWSNSGVVPACRTLDCVTVLALNPDDAAVVHNVAAKFDVNDAYARPRQMLTQVKQVFRFGVPQAGQLKFFGNNETKNLFTKSVNRLIAMGGEAVTIDFNPFIEAAKLLYEGPWVAERYVAIEDFVQEYITALYPVTRAIIEPASKITAVAVFKSLYRLQAYKRIADQVLASVDFIVTPTTGTIYTIEEVNNEPIKLNANLGYYTNFMNLLDYSAIALPSGIQESGLPAGITFFAQAFEDDALLAYAKRYCQKLQQCMGATEFLWYPTETVSNEGVDTVKVAVCGAHLSELPLNYQLTERNARLVQATQTIPAYRLYVLQDGKRPGLLRDDSDGVAIDVEVWEMSTKNFGSFVAQIPEPLGIGSVELRDKSRVKGFICEFHVIAESKEISRFGGWKAYIAQR